MKTALYIISGMLLMYVILKIISSKAVEPNLIWNNVKTVLSTQEAKNLVKTNEFRELVKTKPFVNLIGSLAKEQLNDVSKTLAG
jgi:hypothetical protein